MNAWLPTAVVSLAVLGLTACAGMQERSDAGYVAPQRAPSSIDSDEVYMVQVERIAHRRGVEVIWVNVPRKSLARHDDD